MAEEKRKGYSMSDCVQMSQRYLNEGEFSKAINLSNKILQANSKNIDALYVKLLAKNGVKTSQELKQKLGIDFIIDDDYQKLLALDTNYKYINLLTDEQCENVPSEGKDFYKNGDEIILEDDLYLDDEDLFENTQTDINTSVDVENNNEEIPISDSKKSSEYVSVQVTPQKGMKPWLKQFLIYLGIVVFSLIFSFVFSDIYDLFHTDSGGGAFKESYPCMGKNDTCPNYTHDPHDLYCPSCDRNNNNIEDCNE